MKLTYTTVWVAALSAAGLSSAAAQNYDTPRESTGLYIGGGYSHFDFDEDLGGSAGVHAITARAGWQLLPYLAAEAEASFGFDGGSFDFDGDEDDFDLDDNTDGDLDDIISGPGELGMDYLIGFYGRAILPVNDRFELFARAGYAFVELDSTVQTLGGSELVFGGSEGGFAFGGGASFDLTEAISLRADYTHYEFGDANAEGFGVAFNIKF